MSGLLRRIEARIGAGETMGRVRHVARIAGGYTLLVIGVAGLFLPVIPGTLLIIAGAAMLGWDLKKIKGARDRIVSWWRRKR